jgi:uncharacterized membrane protein YfcA
VPRLAVIATAAGAFSGLFGVGGGAVMVPLLILWARYEEREATGTSLTAIPMIAAIGVLVQGIHGNVHVDDGLIVGLPAIGGVIAGAALQQRVPVRFISAAFAVLLLISAAVLVF